MLNSSEKASSEDVSDEAFEGVANRIRTGDIQNHNLRTNSEIAEKQGSFFLRPLLLDQILDQSDENGPRKQAEEYGRKARKTKRRTGSGNAQTRQTRLPTEARSSNGEPPLPKQGIDFAAAVAGIFALPLSDAEKAEAVRRLLAASGPG